MNIRIFPIAALCLAFGSAIAQGPPREPPSPAEHMERLAILLDLNEGQKVEVAKVLEEQREQMMAMRKEMRASDQRPSREEMQAKREEAKRATLDKLRPILTDQQLKKFEVLAPMGPGARGRHR